MSEKPGHTILVIEDEAPVRKLVTRILEAASYKVFSAELGSEALNVLTQQPVDLVFTDLTLPDVDGVVLIANIRERWPGMRVAAYSGGIQPQSWPEDLPFLAKPFSARDLKTFILSLINQDKLGVTRERAAVTSALPVESTPV